jgi:hypothetical protein
MIQPPFPAEAEPAIQQTALRVFLDSRLAVCRIENDAVEGTRYRIVEG